MSLNINELCTELSGLRRIREVERSLAEAQAEIARLKTELVSQEIPRPAWCTETEWAIMKRLIAVSPQGLSCEALAAECRSGRPESVPMMICRIREKMPAWLWIHRTHTRGYWITSADAEKLRGVV